MKKFKFLACAMLAVFCLSTYTVEAQDAERNQKRLVNPEQRIERQPLKKTKQSKKRNRPSVKEKLKKAEAPLKKKRAEGQILDARNITPKNSRGLKKAEKRSAVKPAAPRTEVATANEAITNGRKKSAEMRKKIAAAKVKFEEGKKTGKYSKEEIAAKEAKLKAAELKVKELEQTLIEESNKISKAARRLK